MGWIIFGCIIGLFAGILSLSAVVTVHYSEEFLIWIGAGPFRYGVLVTEEEQAAREAKKKQKEKKKKTVPVKKKNSNVRQKKPSQPKKKPQKGNVKETVGIVLDLIRAIAGPLPFLLRHFRVTGLDVQVVVGGEDAAEVALNYGKLCGIVHGSLAALKNLISVRIKRVDIFCNFCSEETNQQINFKLIIRLGILLWAALRMAGRFLVYTFRRVVPERTAVSQQTSDRQKTAGSYNK